MIDCNGDEAAERHFISDDPLGSAAIDWTGPDLKSLCINRSDSTLSPERQMRRRFITGLWRVPRILSFSLV